MPKFLTLSGFFSLICGRAVEFEREDVGSERGKVGSEGDKVSAALVQ